MLFTKKTLKIDFQFKNIVYIAVISMLLLGCQPANKQPPASNNVESPGTPQAQSQEQAIKDLQPSFNDLKSSYKEFIQALTQFRSELEKSANQPPEKKFADGKLPNQTLDRFLQENSNFQVKLASQNSDSITNLKQTSQNIDTSIKNIQKIIMPLKDGLQKDKVLEIQKTLNVIEKYKVSEEFHGIYGSKTHSEVENYFNQEVKQLDSKINQLEQTLQKANVPKSQPAKPEVKNVSEFTSKLKAENEKLKVENEKLQEELKNIVPEQHKKNGFIDLLIFLLVFSLGVLAGLKLPQLQLIINNIINNNKSKEEDKKLPETPAEQDKNPQKGSEKQSSSANTSTGQNSPRSEKPSNVTAYNTSASSSSATHSSKPTRVNSSHSPSSSTSNLGNRFSEAQLVIFYNQDSRKLTEVATEVSESEASLNARRLGISQTVILEKTRRAKGLFWIISDGTTNYLVPKDNIRINEYNYKTLDALFDCYNYRNGLSHDFQLLKPAKVYTLIADQKWQLAEYGQLQFEVASNYGGAYPM